MRSTLSAVLCVTLLLLMGPGSRVLAEEKEGAVPSSAPVPAKSSLWDISLTKLEGGTVSMSEYRGKVLLVVNTASKCGFTPQYRDLEELYKRYHERGFEVLGFPANDFAKQEPGTNEEIRSFCTLKYGVTFPMFGKISVLNPAKHPLYRLLTEEGPADLRGEIGWNFEKFLIDSQGVIKARWGSQVNPLNQRITDAIEGLLSEGGR